MEIVFSDIQEIVEPVVTNQTTENVVEVVANVDTVVNDQPIVE